jgi:DNA polymerase I-like protein with 3'-5' exonuclease and polymerase domains/predicted XRE-type DNA-binding protein
LAWVIADIDNEVIWEGNHAYSGEFTLEEAQAHPLVKAHCVLGYTTPSHGRPEPAAPNGIHDKFRLIIPLPVVVEDPALAKQVILRVLQEIPGTDRATVSITNAFYGNTEADFFVYNPEASPVPMDLVLEAAARLEELTLKASEASLLVGVDADTASKVLNLIPNIPEVVEDWYTYRNIMFAAYNAGVPKEVARAWAQTSGRYTEQGFEAVWGPKPGPRMLGLDYLLKKVPQGFSPVPEDFGFTGTLVNPNDVREAWPWEELVTSPALTREMLTIPGVKIAYTERENLVPILHTAMEVGIKNILVSSGTGAGKTTQVTNMLIGEIPQTAAWLEVPPTTTEDVFHGKAVAFVATEKYNPPDPKLLTLDAVPSKNHGLIKDQLPDGRIRFKLAQKPEEANTKPTCLFPEVFHRAQHLGVTIPTVTTSSGAEVSMPCAGCPQERKCPAVIGRRKVLQEQAFRIHPLQLPEPGPGPSHGEPGFSYANTVAIADEVDQWAFTQERTFSREAFDSALCDLQGAVGGLPKEWEAFFYTTLRDGWMKAPETLGRYGIGYADILALVPEDAPVVDTDALRQGLADTNAEVFANLYDGVISDGLSGLEINRERLSQNLDKLRPANAVLLALDILQGKAKGDIRLTGLGELVISAWNDLATRFTQFDTRIMLSATANSHDLARYLGVPEEEILVVEMAPPVGAKVTHTVITDLGRMNRERSADQNRRLKACLDAIKVRHQGPMAVAAYKSSYQKNPEVYQAADIQLTHGVDTIGSNVAEKAASLVSDGVQVPNLAAMTAEYTTLTGLVPLPGVVPVFYRQEAEGLPEGMALCWVGLESADEGLRAYIRQKVVTNQIQTNGRLRANLRPGEELHHYHTACYPVPYPIKVVQAAELSPDAAPRSQATAQKILAAIQTLASQGLTLTQSAIAELSKVSQSRVSNILKDLRKMASQGSLPQVLVELIEALKIIPSAYKYIYGLGIIAKPIQDKGLSPVSGKAVLPQILTPKITPEPSTENLMAKTKTQYSSPDQLALGTLLSAPTTPVAAKSELYTMLNPEDASYSAYLTALELAPRVGLDIETFAPGPKGTALDPITGRVRLIQLATDSGTYVVDLGGRYDDREAIAKAQAPFFATLKAILENPDTVILGHNLSFDLRFLRYQYGLQATRVVDTMIGAKVFYGDYGHDPDDPRAPKRPPVLPGGYSLACVAAEYLGEAVDKSQQKLDWGRPLEQAMLDYAAKDAAILIPLYEAIYNRYLDTAHPLHHPGLTAGWKLENEIIPVFIEIERAGLPVDAVGVATELAKIEALYSEVEAAWYKLYPSVSPTSNPQVTQALGLESSNAEVLQANKDKPGVLQIQQLRALNVLRNDLKYFQRSSESLGEGRIRTIYTSLTGTGRSSSGGTRVSNVFNNLQKVVNAPRAVLSDYDLTPVRSFVRPTEGKVMAVIDLAAAHARIAASEANDSLAIAAFQDPSIDTHSQVAAFIAQAQGLPWSWEYINEARKDKSNPDQAKAKNLRDIAKTTFYSWLNGGGPKRVQGSILEETGVAPSLDDCKLALAGCRNLFSGIEGFITKRVNRINAKPIALGGRLFGVNATSDGFRLTLPMMPDDYGKFEVARNEAIASTWSRIEATAMKRAVLAVSQLAKANPQWGLEIINYVHDEVDVLVDSAMAEEAITQVRDTVGDAFAGVLRNGCPDGREEFWGKLVVSSWADK